MKRSLLFPIVGVMLALLLATPIAAKYSTSFVYTVFNSTAKTWRALDKTYSKGWQVKVQSTLVFNTTEAKTVLLYLVNGTGAADEQLILNFWHNGKVYLKYYAGSGNYADLKNWDYVGDTIILVLDANGYLNIGNSSQTDVYLKNYVLGDFDLSYVGANGETTYVVTGGYVTVEVNDPPATAAFTEITAIVYMIIPLVITIAVLRWVVRVFEKFGR